ncbi:MAG: hypothetical protein PHF67_04315 [Candidatus Nanoarchaeia archaeon]|nr:hypothetical protein [Candidatus Nanoarchaeia archaeon]
MECSITNLGACIVETLFGFIIDLINMSLHPFLNIISKLMTEPVIISLFSDVWGSIVYVLSLFYGLLLIYIGFKFIISGDSPEEREKAKVSLKNTIIMMILIQSSYYLYSLIISISSALTNSILNMAGNDFFYYSSENFSNIGIQVILLGLYLFHLVITVLFLVLRYDCVSIGVIFFAIAIFFYFIPFLHNFGKLILNFLGILIFLPFFYSLVFLGTSRLVESSSLSSIKILIVIGAFSIIIFGTLALYCFIIVKASSLAMKIASPIIKVAKFAGV